MGIIDSIIASLDDPNGDGDREDSFIDRHLSAMFGTPKAFGAVAGVLSDVTGLLDEVAIGPLRLLMRPLKNAIADVKAQVTDFFAGVILDRYGIDVEQFELLTSLGSKLDVKSVRVGDTVVPIFKPADREKLHYYMGIEDAPVDLINLPLDAVPGVEFIPTRRATSATTSSTTRTSSSPTATPCSSRRCCCCRRPTRSAP